MVNDLVEQVTDQRWAALADPTRRRVVELLGRAPMHPSELADELRTSRPALSRHLRTLRQVGLVSVALDDADARGRTYRLDPDGLVGLSAWLDQVQAHWTDQLGRFARHSDRPR